MNLPPGRREKARLFKKLHDRSRLFILPNAWDAVSARIFEEAGFPAIATTSAGIAYSHGYSDLERIPRSVMAAAVHRIAESVRVPVTADIEAGYGGRASDVVETVSAVIDAYGRVLPNARLGLGAFGVIDSRLPPALAPTPYVRWNDWLFAVMMLVSMGAAFVNRVWRA